MNDLIELLYEQFENKNLDEFKSYVKRQEYLVDEEKLLNNIDEKLKQEYYIICEKKEEYHSEREKELIKFVVDFIKNISEK